MEVDLFFEFLSTNGEYSTEFFKKIVFDREYIDEIVTNEFCFSKFARIFEWKIS